MEPREDEPSIDEMRDEMIWDDDGALVFPEPDDDGDVEDRAFGREY